MTQRSHLHSTAMFFMSLRLGMWLLNQPEPRGTFACGEAGVRLTEDVSVGIDLVYYSPEVLAAQTGRSSMIEGVPPLVIEILSPSDTLDGIDDKIDTYLDAGVLIVWIVSPRRQTVTVHRPGVRPVSFNADQELTADPVLPGFRVAVADLFR